MPKSAAFTFEYTGVAFEILTPIMVFPAFEPDDFVQPQGKEYKALWDTGATGTVVSHRIVQELNLKPFGVTPVADVRGKYESNTYHVNLLFPNHVAAPYLRVTEGELGSRFDVLIGMDIINQGDFSLTSGGDSTIFSFQTPSVREIDFTGQRYREQKGMKIGRNDPCPCNSGKKFKRCCGK